LNNSILFLQLNISITEEVEILLVDPDQKYDEKDNGQYDFTEYCALSAVIIVACHGRV
jgi:hypothetical protein